MMCYEYTDILNTVIRKVISEEMTFGPRPTRSQERILKLEKRTDDKL